MMACRCGSDFSGSSTFETFQWRWAAGRMPPISMSVFFSVRMRWGSSKAAQWKPRLRGSVTISSPQWKGSLFTKPSWSKHSSSGVTNELKQTFWWLGGHSSIECSKKNAFPLGEEIVTEYLFMGELLLRHICPRLHLWCSGFDYHWKYVLFVSPVSTTDGDKKKRQKEKETLQPNLVLPIKLATLKVRLKVIKHFFFD